MTIWKPVGGAGVEPVEVPSSVTVGVFDGVHLGHQKLLETCRSVMPDGHCVAITFDPHPAMLFRPEVAPALLTTIERRVELLLENGADEVRVLDFGPQIAALSPEEFIDTVLLGQCHAKNVVVGHNFRFGHRASGTIETLVEAGSSRGFVARAVSLAGDAEFYSSTRVRSAVAEGDMATAARVLSRPHEVTGVVEVGDRRGRELGFPTANVPVDARFAVPPDGVYGGWLVDNENRRMPAAISVGTNPTFAGERARRVEAHVIDRTDLELYDMQVRIEFAERLRPMVAFESVSALVDQMRLDVEQARRAAASN